MAIVHRAFRSAYEESAQLVRGPADTITKPVTLVADHIDFGLEMLHHHHASEDLLLYPLLLERVPEQAEMTEEVAHEHQLVQTALDTAVAACGTWRQHPTVETGEAMPSEGTHVTLHVT